MKKRPDRATKDYGRKPFIEKNPTDYGKFIKRVTNRSGDWFLFLQKQSEFEKPYYIDDYPEMQHWFPWGPWHFDFILDMPDDVDIPLPSPDIEIPDIIPMPPPLEDPDEGALPGGPQMFCFPSNPTKIERGEGEWIFIGGAWSCENVTAEIVELADGGTGFSLGPISYFEAIGGWTACWALIVSAAEDAQGSVPILFTGSGCRGQGKKGKKKPKEGKDSCICEVSVAQCPLEFSYDSENPEEMGRSEGVDITIIGGLPPFSWYVTGQGFSFEDERISARINTLYTDGSACGAGSITVVDACNTVVTGAVRCTYGGWVLVSSELCNGYEGSCAFCTCCDEFIIGKYKYKNCWIGGKACTLTGETCEPYPGGANLAGNQCYVVGYETPATCGPFWSKTKWEWECA